jgi:hypothetical protein
VKGAIGETVMIKDRAKLEEFERQALAAEDLSYAEALAIFEALRQEAVLLGAFTSENVLDGLEINIRLAKAINGLPK